MEIEDDRYMELIGDQQWISKAAFETPSGRL